MSISSGGRKIQLTAEQKRQVKIRTKKGESQSEAALRGLVRKSPVNRKPPKVGKLGGRGR